MLAVGRGSLRLSGSQSEGMMQDTPEERASPSHQAFQPCWLVRARSRQSWPSQTKATMLLPAWRGTPPQSPPACPGRARRHLGWRWPCRSRDHPADISALPCSVAMQMWQSIFSEPEIRGRILWPFAVMLWVDWWPCSLGASSSESSSISDLAVSYPKRT